MANIAIVVGEDFQHMVSILAESVEELQNAILVIILRVSRVKNSEEEVVDEDTDGLFEVLTKVQE